MASGGHMLRVGPFIFSLGTAAYQKFTRKDTWRWVSIERIGNELANQYVGPGERTITLDGVIYTHFDMGRAPFSNSVVGLRQVAALRGAAEMATPLMVTDGMGNNFGRWVVTDLQEMNSNFYADGAYKKQEFNLNLRFYGAGSSGGGALSFGGFGNLLAVSAVFASATGLGRAPIGVTVAASAQVKANMLSAGVTLGVFDG